MFEKKELERMLTRKTWDYVIDLREELVLKKRKIYLLLRIERAGSEVFKESVEEEVYLTIEITTNITIILCTKEEWKEENGTVDI